MSSVDYSDQIFSYLVYLVVLERSVNGIKK